jgi:hypothetical protein
MSANVEDPSNQFLLKEFACLRREMDDCVKAIWDIERYALLVTGGIWAWSIPQSGIGFAAVTWLPLGLNLLFGMRVWALYRHVYRISNYLLLIEQRFLATESEGWERYFRKNTDPFTFSTAFVLWSALLLTSVIAPLIVGS